MIFTPAELATPVWAKLREHLTERLSSHRAANDCGVLAETETARLRGRIAELKDLLAIEQQPAADDAPGE
jgi:hypothetical protein